jgi:hypothetical protein
MNLYDYGEGGHYLLVELNLPYNNAGNWMTMCKYVILYMCVGV